jgi:hypothetical protein
MAMMRVTIRNQSIFWDIFFWYCIAPAMTALCVTVFFSKAAFGQVTSRPCPYNCRLAGIPKESCRDWREQDVCYIEVIRSKSSAYSKQFGTIKSEERSINLRRPSPNYPSRNPTQYYDERGIQKRYPDHESNIVNQGIFNRGFLIARICPFSCGSEGYGRACRDWREGDICYLEDLTRPRQQGPIYVPRAPSAPEAPSAGRPLQRYPKPPPYGRPGSAAISGTGFGSVPERRPQLGGVASGSNSPRDDGTCYRVSRHDIAPPRISIYNVKNTGNFFDDMVKISGFVEGSCLVEAGAFERGRLEQSIPIVTTRQFRRYEFTVVTDKGRSPEIRVYNATGDGDFRIPLEDRYQQQNDPYLRRPYGHGTYGRDPFYNW